MRLYEMFDERPEDYTSEKDDHSVMKLSDLRKTRLTLAHLNKLRMANDVRKLEAEQSQEHIKQQYSAPPAEAMGGGGLGF